MNITRIDNLIRLEHIKAQQELRRDMVIIAACCFVALVIVAVIVAVVES